MKGVYILILVLQHFTALTQDQTVIEGKVTDAKTGEPIMFGTVAIYKEGVLYNGTETDLDGAYFFTNVRPGTYDMEASLLGYAAQRLQGLVIKAGRTNRIDFQLSDDAGLLDLGVEVKCYHVRLIDADNATMGTTVTAEKIRNLPTKSVDAIRATAAGISSGEDVSMRSSRSNETTYYIDGIRMPPPLKLENSENEKDKSGLITAGEWNDLVHWEKWNDLIRQDEFKDMNAFWRISTKARYPVFVVNEFDKPMAGVRIHLRNQQDSILWSTISDMHGRAELFRMNNEKFSDLYLEYEYLSKRSKIKLQKDLGKQSIHIKLNAPCRTVSKANIAFVVDATGSMGDEIQFLQSDLLSVLEGVETRNSDFSIKYASVFYRDLGEEYTTRAFDFETRSNDLISFIEKQRAGGGQGNFAAVDSALMKTLHLSWETDANVKLIFLFLDAPPRQNNIEKYKNAIRKAAEAGIKIIPVSGSGLDRKTEFLLKFTAILTNGTYTFITNHSGIGGDHLPPVHNDFEVEKLSDLLQRIINGFIHTMPCDDSDPGVTDNIGIFPNPASDVIHLSIQNPEFMVADILSSTGQVLIRTKEVKDDKIRFDIQNLVSGHYYARVVYPDTVITQSFLKIN